MRILSIIFISTALLLSTGCGDAQVSGRSFKSSLRSANKIKSRLPQNVRVPFELSYWAIRDYYRDNKEFLDIVGGKTSTEIIATGKEVFLQRKADGFTEYQKYSTWGEMISKYQQERQDQLIKRKYDPRDGENSVIYNL
ncbi:MAG: hypothetical protein GQ581_04095 [Methyloprofundus sp.]|nr:hypothetical protein [Methyloprofundus sp.]